MPDIELLALIRRQFALRDFFYYVKIAKRDIALGIAHE